MVVRCCIILSLVGVWCMVEALCVCVWGGIC